VSRPMAQSLIRSSNQEIGPDLSRPAIHPRTICGSSKPLTLPYLNIGTAGGWKQRGNAGSFVEAGQVLNWPTIA
jgi:hypothetical protein